MRSEISINKKTSDKKDFDELTPKQQSFILEFIKNGNNATKAYSKIFNIHNSNVAAASGSRMLRNVKISSFLENYYHNLWKSKEREIGKAFSNLLRIANSDISNVVDYKDRRMIVRDFDKIDTTIVKSISQTVHGENINTSIVLHDKVKAISELLKVLNMINDKLEIFGDIEILPPTIPNDLRRQHGESDS